MNRRLRVAVVGGPDIRLRRMLVLRLSRQFEMTVLGSDHRAGPEFHDIGTRYASYPMTRGINPCRDARTVAALIRLLRGIRPDIVHTYDSKPSALGRMAAVIAGVRVVVGTLPGLGSLYANDRLRTRIGRAFYEITQGMASRLSDATILQNHDDLRDMLSRGVVPLSKAQLIAGSGVDTVEFRPDRLSASERTRVKKTLGLEDGTVVVTMVARLIRAKGVIEFAAASGMVRRVYPRVRFILIGEEDRDSGDSLTRVERKTVESSVDWLGPRSDIADVLSVSDVFVLPSRYMEGIPRALLEAAACGLPIVTADARGCREVVEHGVSGLLVPVGNVGAISSAILTLLDSPSKRMALGREARVRTVKEFNVAAVADTLAKLYFHLLDRPPVVDVWQ